MPDKHYPDENYSPGVPDLSGLDYAVEMMRNAPSRDAMPDSSARLEIARLEELLRQSQITISGLRRTLDTTQQRAQHTQRTNRDLIGRNERLKTRVDVAEKLAEDQGAYYRISVDRSRQLCQLLARVRHADVLPHCTQLLADIDAALRGE